MPSQELSAADRLIVALDVPTHDEALRLVDRLENVSVFKIGIQLFLAGDLYGFLQRLRERRRPHGGVFIDLKLAGDIGNTIASFVKQSRVLGIRFITLVQADPLAITRHSLQAARAAAGQLDNAASAHGALFVKSRGLGFTRDGHP